MFILIEKNGNKHGITFKSKHTNNFSNTNIYTVQSPELFKHTHAGNPNVTEDGRRKAY